MKRQTFYFALCAAAAIFLAASVPAAYAVGDYGIVVEQVQNPEKEMQCRVCGRPINPGVIHTDAPAIVKEKLKTALTDRNIGYSDGSRKGQLYLNVLIYRYQERKGGNYAIEKPASVAFHMHLMKDNVLGKTFVYTEEQKALTQNLFTMGKFLKRGGRWVTADELAEEGVNAGIENLIVSTEGAAESGK